MRNLGLILFASAALAHGATCDRECLRGFATQYLDALVAHKPAGLPVAANVRFTEDTVETKLGDSPLWKNATRLRPYRLDILDVRQGVAASLVILEESGSPVMLMLRLKVADKKITEVETQVTRNKTEGSIFEVDALQSPSKAMLLTPEASQRNSREEAIKIAEHYPAGLKARQLRPGGCALRRRRLSLRERAIDGRSRLHLHAWLYRDQIAEDPDAC